MKELSNNTRILLKYQRNPCFCLGTRIVSGRPVILYVVLDQSLGYGICPGMPYNGQPVWFVAASPGTGEFFAGPDRWYEVVMS
jgi:hypothetical protein